MIPPHSRCRPILRELLGFSGHAAAAVAAYERAFAERFGGGEAIAFDHGRTALYAILLALDIQSGDEIVLGAYTCHSVPRTIRLAGATPVFVDINPHDFGPAPAAVEAALGRRTRAVLLQHSYGWPVRVEAICDAARRAGAAVIEDCCQTLGARIGPRPVGTFGVAAFYSSQWNKPYSTGQGGVAVVQDGELAQRVRRFRDGRCSPPSVLARKVLATELLAFELLMRPRTAALLTSAFRRLSRVLPLPGGSDRDDAAAARAELESPAQLTALQAQLGLFEVQRFETVAARRLQTATRLIRAARRLGYTVPAEPEDADAVPLRVPLRVRDPRAAIQAARRWGFDLAAWFDVPLDPLANARYWPGYQPGSCRAAESAARQVVLIPVDRRVTPAVCARVEQFLEAQRDLLLPETAAE